MLRTTTAILAVLASLLLTATGAQALEAQTSEVVELSATEAAEAQFLAQINDAREDVGVGPLVINDELTGIARDWSMAMYEAGEMTHNPHFSEQYSGEGVLSENVGHYNWPTGDLTVMVDVLHQAFMDSKGHRRNIERERFNQVGIGVVHLDGQLWVTVNFLDGPVPAQFADVDTETESETDDGTEEVAPLTYHSRR